MIKLNNINILFRKKRILHGNFQAKSGQLTGLIGESGSGKTSLLNLISLYYYDQDFDYFFNDTNLKNVSKEDLLSHIKQNISYLRQIPQFLESMTCLENLQLECDIAGVKKTKEDILEILNHLQLKDKAHQYPKKLSGGQKQRLMIASVILKDATIILCDEITSSLDSTNTQKLLDILKDLAHNQNKIVIIASHDEQVKQTCDVIYEIKDKKMVKVKETIDPKKNLIFKEKNKPKKNYFFKIALSRLRKKKVVFALLLLVASITTATSTYASAWLNQQRTHLQDSLEDAFTNEIFIKVNNDSL